MRERFTYEGMGQEKQSPQHLLTQALSHDVALHREADRQLFNNIDPVTPVKLLRKRGEAFVALASILVRHHKERVSPDFVKELSGLSERVRDCLERGEDGLLHQTLSPQIEQRSPSGKTTIQRGNLIQVLIEKHFSQSY